MLLLTHTQQIVLVRYLHFCIFRTKFNFGHLLFCAASQKKVFSCIESPLLLLCFWSLFNNSDCFVLLSSPLDIVYRAEAYKQQGKHHIDGLAQAILVPPLMAYLRRELRCTPREFEYVVYGSGGPHAAAQRFMQLFGKMESSDVCFVVECALHVDRIAFFVELASEEKSKVVRQCVQWTFQQCCCTDNCPFGIGDLHGLLQKDRCLL